MRRSYLTLAAVCTFWGTIPLVAERSGLPAGAIVFGRVWLAAAGLGAALVLSKAAPAAGRLGRRPGRVVLTGLLLAAHWTAMFAAYERAPDDVVAFIVFLAPIGIALLAPSTLGERLGVRTLTALAIAVGGLVLVAGPSRTSSAGMGLALAAFTGATLVAIVLLAKPLSEELGGMRLTFLQMVVAGTAMAPLAVFADWGAADGVQGWLWLALLGLVHTGIGTALYLSALSRVPATNVGILGYLEPVGVVVFGWLLADASPKLTTLVGGGLIIAAGALVMTSSSEEEAVRVPG